METPIVHSEVKGKDGTVEIESVPYTPAGPNSKGDKNEIREITNPTNEDFVHSYNGKEYVIKAGETRVLAEFLALHLSFHLAKKILLGSGNYEDDYDEKSGGRLENPLTKDDIYAKQAELLDVRANEPEEKVEKEVKEVAQPGKEKFICDECGFEAASEFGLQSHMRKHKK